MLCSVAAVMSNSLRLHGLYPPGSSVHRIFQARIPEWVAMPSSRGFSEPGIESTSPASQVNSLLLSHWGSSLYVYMGFPGGSEVKRLPGMREIRVQCLGQEDPLEKAMAPHSSTLAWKIPWTEEPGGL